MNTVALLVSLSLAAAAAAAAASPSGRGQPEHFQHSPGGDDAPEEVDDYSALLAGLLRSHDKRSCIPRGSSCDARPYDCCSQGTCRCNLWGSNCKCARGSLFAAWGRR
ncbi:hypothetical protein FJT64_001722 [Amphibalanus amphitrite]|uniref:U8-agatoxin-Ao1a n=1 Tax=Amphibalanus amphitrite TaxID=1232801 RepID=A0A6A4X0A3_AMPAM|nr:hypothetical protein FJT64_001722 [Amphibalanus amphitrite]